MAAVKDIGPNLTRCDGAIARIDTPSRLLRDHLPPAYEPRLLVAEVGGILLIGLACETLSAGGLDRGSAAFAFTAIFVKPLTGRGSANTVHAYMLEAWSNHSAVRDWWKGLGLASAPATYEGSNSPLPISQEMVMGRIVDDRSAPYAFTVFPSQGTTTRTYDLALYCAPQPDDCGMGLNFTGIESWNLGGGRLEARSDTKAAQIFRGAGPANVVGTRADDLRVQLRMLEPPRAP